MAESSPRALFLLGAVLMILALFLQNVTLVNARYAGTLLTALGLTAAADVCFAGVAWRGGPGWRVAAGVGALPTFFILAEFVCRAPHVF